MAWTYKLNNGHATQANLLFIAGNRRKVRIVRQTARRTWPSKRAALALSN